MARGRREQQTANETRPSRPIRAVRIGRPLPSRVAESDDDAIDSSDVDEEYVEHHQRMVQHRRKDARVIPLSLEPPPVNSVAVANLPQVLCPSVAKRSKIFVMVQKGNLDELLALFTGWHNTYTVEQEQVGLELFNFLIETAGFPGNFIALQDAEGKKPQVILDEALGTLDLQGFELNPKFPLHTTERTLSSFPDYFRQFWSLFVSVLEDNLLDHQLYEDVVSRLLPLSSHMIRNLRHTGTVAGFALCDGIIDLFKVACEDRARYQVQLYATQSSSKSSELVRKTIEQKLAACEIRIQRYGSCIHELNGTLSIRWRDRCPLIRKETFEALFRSITKCPKFYFEDSKKCRFIGPALYDRDPNIRISAAEFLCLLIQNDEIFTLLAAQASTPPGTTGPSILIGIWARLLELPNDLELRVRLAGIKILIQLGEREMLTDEEIYQINEGLWQLESLLHFPEYVLPSRSRQYETYSEIRSSFAEFINTTMFTQSVFRPWPSNRPDSHSADDQSGGEVDVLDLRKIVEFLMEFVSEDYLVLIDRFVSAFWAKTPSLRCIGKLLEFFLVGDASHQDTLPKLDERYRPSLIALIRSVYKHLDLASHKENAMGISIEASAFWLEVATLDIISQIPSITRVSKADSSIMSTSASIIFLASLNAELVKSKIDIEQNVKVLCDLLLNCSFPSTFDHLSAALFNLENFEGNPLQSAQEMVDRVLEEIRGLTSESIRRQSKSRGKGPEPLVGNVEQQYAQLNLYLRRLLAIAKSANSNIFWDNWDIIDILFKICEARANDGSKHINTSMIMITFQCLALSGLHLESDILEFENEIHFLEETKISNGPEVELGAANKRTDVTAAPMCNSIVTLSDDGPRLNRKKRGRPASAEQGEELSNSRKRRAPQPGVSSTSTACDNDHHVLRIAEIVKAIEARLNRLISLRQSLSAHCLNLVKDDPSPFVPFVACTSLLDTMGLLSSNPATDRAKQLWKGAAEKIRMNEKELLAITKYLKGCIQSVEEVLYQPDSAEIQVHVGTQTLHSSALPLRFKVPIIDDILDGVIDPDINPQTTDERNSPSFKRFLLWRVLCMIRLFAHLGDVRVFGSSITSLSLSLWWFNRHDLNAALTQYMTSLLSRSHHDASLNDDSSRSTLLWTVLEHITVVMTMDRNRRQRVKLTLQKIAKVLPPNYVSAHMDQFVNVLMKVALHKACGKTVVPYFTCFVPNTDHKPQFLKELKDKITDSGKSETILATLMECFIEKVKRPNRDKAGID